MSDTANTTTTTTTTTAQPPESVAITPAAKEDGKTTTHTGPTDAEIVAHEQALEEEITQDSPLLASELQTWQALQEEYQNNNNFTAKLQGAEDQFLGLRKVRGDGNCFYRAYVFGVLEQCLTDEALCQQVTAQVVKSLDFCVTNGASRFVLEDFHEPLVDTLKWIAEAKTPLTPEQLVERLVDPEVADYIVYYCRALVSAHFYGNWAQFEHILLPSVDLYIKANVEPMGRDADHPQILALASQFGVPVKVYYLDQTPGKLGGYVFPDLGEESPPRVTLLYRPGHYDLMYPK